MKIERLSGANSDPGGMAARLPALDLRDGLSSADERELDALWNDVHVLIIPGQSELAIENQVDFLSRFGPVLEERVPGDRHSFVSNDDGRGLDEMSAGYREGELTPHMDYTYTSYPADVISLFAVALPAGGTQTRFYDNVAPLARMPADLRKRLETFSIFCAHDLAAMKPDARLYLEPRTNPDAPTQSHIWPLLRTHPRKPNTRALACTLQQTERIMELSDLKMDDAESRALLGRIFDEFLYVPENEYIHDWQLGDLVVWDNHLVQHARSECPAGDGARTLRRVAVCEAGNAIDETVAFLDLSDSSVAFS